jgi:DNA-binding response OmpR family regulator
MRVLLVEDYAPLRESMAQALSEEGFAVDSAADGAVGEWHAQSGEHDVIVLDISLPGKDGLTLLREARARGLTTPVLLVTARDTVPDRVKGLDLGADDYLVKPFALAELLARVRALIRRRCDAGLPLLRVRDLEIDTTAKAVRRAGKAINLTAREYALLEFLARRAGCVVSRTDIVTHVYDFNASIESNVIDVYVGYLRRKLECEGSEPLIRTRRGLGYVLE